MPSPAEFFQSLRYQRSNARRLEHLASLPLPLVARTVLEAGAGIGDLTHFFLDRDCSVTSVEPRPENVAYFRTRYAADPLWPDERLRIVQSTVEELPWHEVGPHDIVFCYGLLNELDAPETALRILADRCRDLLLLEVSVAAGAGADDDAIHSGTIDPADLRASVTGRRTLPTRRWVFRTLRAHFAHVYVTRTQPVFDRFRLDWREAPVGRQQNRIIFVASRSPLGNDAFAAEIPDVQEYHLPRL